MTKTVGSHALALSAWALKKAHIVSYQETRAQIAKICMQSKFLTYRDFPLKP